MKKKQDIFYLARMIAKRLRVPGVTKRLLRPMLREAMFHRDELVTFEL